MKHIIIVAAIVSILSGCAAIDGGGGGGEPASNTAQTDAEMVDAVTRRPLQPVQPAEPAVDAADLLAETQPPEALPETANVYSGAPVQQMIDPGLNPATARSYNATWEYGGFRHRSVMFPHIIDGCKVMIQSRRTLDYVAGSTGEFFEREGPDCNCDLVIDGFEDVFAQLNDEYKTPRMYDVCAGPGVDGATRQLEIMRESLKEDRNFDKMKNVDGF